MLIKNKSNKHFNFITGAHGPGVAKPYNEKTGNLILKSYPDYFKEKKIKKDKKSGGIKCQK